MAFDMIGGQIQALVVHGFRVVQHLCVLRRNAQLVIGRSQVVVGIRVASIGLLGLLKKLQRFGVSTLLVESDPLPIAIATSQLASTGEDDQDR